MVGRRARGQGTPQEHIDALLLVNLDEIIQAIAPDNEGFFNLVLVLDDRMFSSVEKDTRARELYDTKVRKIKKMDKTFVEFGKEAEKHLKRVRDWINEHGTLSTSDYRLITTLNKEAADLGDTTRQSIDNALKEVKEALDQCEDDCQGVEQPLYIAAQEYLSGVNRVYAA